MHKINLYLIYLFFLSSFIQISFKCYPSIEQAEEEKIYINLEGLVLGDNYLKTREGKKQLAYMAAIPTKDSAEAFHNYIQKKISPYFKKAQLNLDLSPKENIHCTIRFPQERCSLIALEEIGKFDELKIKNKLKLILLYSPNTKKFYVGIAVMDFLKKIKQKLPTLYANTPDISRDNYLYHISVGTIQPEEIYDKFPEIKFEIGEKSSNTFIEKLQEKYGPIQPEDLPVLIFNRIKLERFGPKKLGDGPIPITDDLKRPNLLPKILEILRKKNKKVPFKSNKKAMAF